MKRIFPLLLLLCLCGCKNTWNEDDEDTWRTACHENAMKWAGSDDKAKTYCECVLSKMKQKYPNENDALEHISELATDTALMNCREQK